MATKETKTQQTSTDQNIQERAVTAPAEIGRSASPQVRDATNTQSLSTEADAAIASFAKTARELAVLPPK